MKNEAIVKAVGGWLEKRSWHANYNGANGYFVIGIKLNCLLPKVKLVVHPKFDGCLFYVIPQLSCSDNRMLEAAKYLTLANCGLINGNFEMNMRSGDFRYKCFIDCAWLNDLPFEVIDATMKCACATFRRYADGLFRVVAMNSDANNEILQIEARQAI